MTKKQIQCVLNKRPIEKKEVWDPNRHNDGASKKLRSYTRAELKLHGMELTMTYATFVILKQL